MGMVEGYASATSVKPGDAISLHLRSEPPHFRLRIEVILKGKLDQSLHIAHAGASAYPTPANAYEVGCDWPVAYVLNVPQDWASGLYIARVTSVIETGSQPETTDIPFVVKAAIPGKKAKILLQLTFTTYQAYNNWGGKSLYDYNSTYNKPATKVSYNRPFSAGGDGWNGFFYWELPTVRWLEDNNIAVDYCTSIDLHADPTLLDKYRLLLSVGHDEYWSKNMRDHAEAHVAAGGNIAFFSGNVCWWQVRFEDNDRTMVCFKDKNLDPLTASDPSLVTVNWYDDPVNRPENSLTGVSFRNGAGWWDNYQHPRIGYRVRNASHWVFQGTDLENDEEFGADESIIGYENDAALFAEANGTVKPTGADGTPIDAEILATAEMPDWGPHGQAGKATMVVFTKNNGTVFTSGCTDWAYGLTVEDSKVPRITLNVLKRLGAARRGRSRPRA